MIGSFHCQNDKRIFNRHLVLSYLLRAVLSQGTCEPVIRILTEKIREYKVSIQ